MVKKYIVELTPGEREELLILTSANKTAGHKVIKAFILLKADEGWRDEDIVAAYGVSLSNVERTRQRFVEGGLESALNRHPSSRVYSRKIGGEEEAHLIALCCSKPPEGHAQWTMQLLADKMVELKYVDSLSDETVRQVLKRNQLKPWQKKSGVSHPRPMPPLSAKWKKS